MFKVEKVVHKVIPSRWNSCEVTEYCFRNRCESIRIDSKGAATRYDSLVRSLPIALCIGQSKSVAC